MTKGYLVALALCIISIFVYLINAVEYSSPTEILEETAKKDNYPFETHTVLTEDNYLLTVHRLPGAPGSTPVYLQHGLLSSSADWFFAGKNRSLPYILHDNGYDVWVGNVRGNQFSRAHKTLSQNDPEFWNFTWSELGFYDVPAIILYISKITNSKIFYVGHSMGCTTFSVMASERPEVAKNVKVMVGFAPATYEYHIRHPLIKLVSKYWQEVLAIAKSLGVHTFLSRNSVFDFLANRINLVPEINQLMYTGLFHLIDGVKPLPMNEGFPNFVGNFPSGTSIKLFVHWLQQMNINEFQKFDYGKEMNLKVYGSIDPPKYDLSKVQVPIAIFYSDNDFITVSEDVEHYYNQLPLKLGLYKVNPLTHSDFLWREKAVNKIYYEILHIFKNY